MTFYVSQILSKTVTLKATLNRMSLEFTKFKPHSKTKFLKNLALTYANQTDILQIQDIQLLTPGFH